MKQPAARSPIARFRVIVDMLRHSRAPIPVKDFADRLEVSLKCIYRDLDFMRDQLGLPIITRKTSLGVRSGVYLTEKLCLCDLCSRPR